MHKYQREFIEFALRIEVLRFGEFKLKSGRISPYFFNAGLFNTGAVLAQLGRFYAQALEQSDIEYDMLFGPAYKGIPLVSALGIALADQHDRDVPYAFNRKEVKDHGEGGLIVGAPLAGRVVIVDDVISAGTSVRESLDIIEHNNATAAGVLIALDRQERGEGTLSAIQELEQKHELPVASIISLDNLIEYLADQDDMQSAVERIAAYRKQYGA